MIAFTCSCNTPLHRHDSEAGAKTICPACGQEYLIPGLSSEEELAGQLLLSMEKDVAARAPIATGVDGAPDRSRAIRFSCPHCSAVIKASVAKAGTRVKCPKCKLTLEVPVARGKLLEDQPRPSRNGNAPSVDCTSQPAAPLLDPCVTEVVDRRHGQVPGRAPEKQWQRVLWTAVGVGMLLGTPIAVVGVGLLVWASVGWDSTPAGATQPRSASTVPMLPDAPAPALTEFAATERLKTALQAWSSGGTPANFARRHPDLEFVDPYFSDGVILLRFEVERTQLDSYSGSCDVSTSLVTRRADGGEIRYPRVYQVKSPDKRGVWRIGVSPTSPPGPGVARVNPPRDLPGGDLRELPGFAPLPGFQPPPALPGVGDMPVRECFSCRGTGFTERRCGSCGGSGKEFGGGGLCRSCKGNGLQKCGACSGRGAGGGGGFVP